MTLLYFTHHEGALDGAYALYLAQFRKHELLILLHVAGSYAQKVVVVARRIVALRYLRQSQYVPREFVGDLVVDVQELHLAEYQQLLAELFGVEHRHIFLYIAQTFEPFLSLKHRRGGQVHLLGKLFGGQFCVALQYFQ